MREMSLPSRHRPRAHSLLSASFLITYPYYTITTLYILNIHTVQTVPTVLHYYIPLLLHTLLHTPSIRCTRKPASMAYYTKHMHLINVYIANVGTHDLLKWIMAIEMAEALQHVIVYT